MIPATLLMTYKATITSVKRLVVPDNASPFVRFYDENLTKLSDPSTTPGATPQALAITADGMKIAVATASSIIIYNGVDLSVITTLLSPGSGWTNIRNVRFSPDGTRLLVCDPGTAPYLWVFNTTSWASVTAPSTAGDMANCADYNFDGSQIIVGTNANALIRLYRTSDMVQITGPTTNLPTSPGRAIACAPSGTHVALLDTANALWVYRVSDWTRVSSAVQPAATVSSLDRVMQWNADGSRLAICEQATPFAQVFARATDTLTADTVAALSGIGRACAFFSNGTRMIFGTQGTPKVETYDRSGTSWTHTTAADVSNQPAGNPFSLCTNI